MLWEWLHAAVSHGVDGAPTARSSSPRPRGVRVLLRQREVGEGTDKRARDVSDSRSRAQLSQVDTRGPLDHERTAQINVDYGWSERPTQI